MHELEDEKTDPDLDLHRLMAEAAVDRRLARRVPMRLDVTLASGEEIDMGVVENLSEGGLFVATPSIRPIGSVVELCVAVPELDRTIVGWGEVCWARSLETSSLSQGMGIRFFELEARADETIDALVARHR